MAMKSKHESDDLINRKIAQARATGNTSASRTLRNDLTAIIMNTDGDYTVYGESKGEPTQSTVNPGMNFRKRIAAKASKALKLDSQTTEELATSMEFDAKDASALLDVAEISGALYNASGKSTNLPCLDERDGRMSYRVVTKPATSMDTNRLEKQADGSYVSVPTGVTRHVEEHNALKVSNRPWRRQVSNKQK